MVYEYLVDIERRCVRVRVSGVLTGAALRSMLKDLQQDPRVTSDYSALIDFRDVRSLNGLQHDEVRSIARSVLRTVARRAFVAHDLAVFGVCRMFATCCEIAEGEPVAVFRSVVDAERWLDLSAEAEHVVTRPLASVTIAPVSSLSAHEHVETLWHSSNVCCCLVSRKNPTKYCVHVCVDQKPFLEERVSHPDEAARVAEKFWAQYTDAQEHSGETPI